MSSCYNKLCSNWALQICDFWHPCNHSDKIQPQEKENMLAEVLQEREVYDLRKEYHLRYWKIYTLWWNCLLYYFFGFPVYFCREIEWVNPRMKKPIFLIPNYLYYCCCFLPLSLFSPFTFSSLPTSPISIFLSSFLSSFLLSFLLCIKSHCVAQAGFVLYIL